MKLKPEEPSHGAFSTFGETLKSLVNQYALVTAYTQRGGIHKADAGTNAQQDFLDENGQLQQDFLFQFHKTVIGHMFGKEMSQMLAYIF